MAAPILVKSWCVLLFANFFSCYETQQLILGTGTAIWWVTEPHSRIVISWVVCLVCHFHPNLILAWAKIEPTQVEPLRDFIKGRLLALLANIRLGCRWLTMTNTVVITISYSSEKCNSIGHRTCNNMSVNYKKISYK